MKPKGSTEWYRAQTRDAWLAALLISFLVVIEMSKCW